MKKSNSPFIDQQIQFSKKIHRKPKHKVVSFKFDDSNKISERNQLERSDEIGVLARKTIKENIRY